MSTLTRLCPCEARPNTRHAARPLRARDRWILSGAIRRARQLNASPLDGSIRIASGQIETLNARSCSRVLTRPLRSAELIITHGAATPVRDSLLQYGARESTSAQSLQHWRRLTHWTDLFALGQQALAAQPFSRFLGAQLTTFRRGEAELVIPITSDLLQQHSFIHGGVLSYAADNALTFAGGSVLGPNVVTAEYKINYLKPAHRAHLIARASVAARAQPKTGALARFRARCPYYPASHRFAQRLQQLNGSAVL